VLGYWQAQRHNFHPLDPAWRTCAGILAGAAG